ncbi:6-phosphogluconolactonase [Paraliobacillus sp. PM-2]|uniref:lactonase family protein n=1 Tax=Paraliobacillus sp. PM-2 TaxID=1462524 RepID=UPI00061BB216|nr:lactonase family protein [Paraliobacillus sp. PM-2]CQR47874.1 6-phosphogluconolactonase [Paraliobacillus sp. PM-2]
MGNQFIGYIGTYTKQESEGVYKFVLDSDKGLVTEVTSAAKLDNPTYLTVSKDNKYLYAVSKEGENGGIASFTINPETGQLSLLNSQTSVGSAPCHVSVKSDNSNVVTANYHTKQVKSYLTNQDGSLQPAIDVAEHDGSGPHERQEKPHMHYAGFTPDENFIIAIDLGSDNIITYKSEEGKLTKVHTLQTKPGSGPRHITFHPNGQYAYVMTELSSEVIVLSYNKEEGSFTENQSISAIPTDYKGVNDGSAIHVTKDGKFVYVANRGHNSIAQFAINQENGELTFIEWVSTEGDWPRDFVIDPTENYVVASNQKSGTLTLYKRDKVTGELTMIQKNISAPEAVCVKFLN